jgi:hypothetical protein
MTCWRPVPQLKWQERKAGRARSRASLALSVEDFQFSFFLFLFFPFEEKKENFGKASK